MEPFGNLNADPLMQEMDRKVREQVPTWGNILPRIDANLDPVLKKHEEDLRTSYGYEKRRDGSWVIKSGFDPPGKTVWGNEPRGQVEVPPYSVQQGRAPGPHGMEQHQGGRVIGVADQMEENRKRAERERAQAQEDALSAAERPPPPRYKGDKQKEGYATIVTPLQGLQRVHVKSPQYKWAKKGKNGYSMPGDPAVMHDATGAFRRGTDLREIPGNQLLQFEEATDEEMDAIRQPPAPPAPPAPPVQRQEIPPGMIRDTDVPGTQFVNAPGGEYPFDPNAGIDEPPGGEYPPPTDEMFGMFRRRFGAVNINPDSGEQWEDNEQMRKWFWRNQDFFAQGMRQGGIVDEGGNPVLGDAPRLLGPFGQRRGVNNRPPQGQPQSPENWWAFPDAAGPQGAPPARPPPPGMMFGNRQLDPTGPVDPNAPVPGFIPGVDSRDYPPFNPNQPFGYQQPSSERVDTVSGQARRQRRRADNQAPPRPQAPVPQAPVPQAPVPQAPVDETSRLEEKIPEVSFEELKERHPIDQRIRVGEADDPTVPGLPHQSSKLQLSKLRGEEQAAAIEDLIISGDEQYLIDHGILSSGEIAQLKVELIRKGRMGSTYPGQTPAQRVLGAAAGSPVQQIEGGLAGATSPDAPAPSQQLKLLQKIRIRRAARQLARQQGRQ